MIKKVIIYIFLTLFCFSFNMVYAKVKPEEITVTCVYENGVQIDAFYSDGSYGLYASQIKVANQIEVPSVSGIKVFYNENSFAKKIVDSGSCPNQIGFGIMIQADNNIDTETNSPGSSATANLYYHTDDSNKVYCPSYHYYTNGVTYCSPGASSTFDYNFFNTHQIQYGFTPTQGWLQKTILQTDSILYKKCSWSRDGYPGECFAYKFSLINERVELNTESEAVGQWAFKSEGDQAASKVMYVRMHRYEMPDGKTWTFVEKDNVMNIVPSISEGPKDGVQNYLCMETAAKTIEDSSFSYSDIRHYARITTNPSCYAGQTLYKQVDWDEAAGAGGTMTSICDIIPETSLILAEFTQWARVIVPAFLIILTGFDISKIVISGNLEEELPKRRKHIIIRAIVAVIFFFLPLFVQVVISSTQGVDFGDVSCIWN